MSNTTFAQAGHALTLIEKKGLSKEELNILFISGMLSDLLDADLSKVNRHEFRRFLNLSPTGEDPLDFIVRVNRSIKPSYGDLHRKLMNPKLELAGPAEYNLQDDVEQWLHDDQKSGAVLGTTIYQYLKTNGGLATCLNLQDGLAIIEKGIGVFLKLFAGKTMPLWGSVGQHHPSYDLRVPYLTADGAKVGLGWGWLNNKWDSKSPALRFRKKHSPSEGA